MKPRTVKIIKLKKKYAILLIVALLLVFGIVAGVSYAFFTSTVAGKEYVVYSGNLEIAYEKKTDVINLQAAKPMTNTEGLATTPYSFDVKNNGTLATKYQVRLETDNSNTLPLEYVKISVFKNDVQYLKPTKLSNLNANLVIVDDGLLQGMTNNTPTTDNYKIRLWVDLGAGNDVVGKEFKGRVVIDAMQNVEDGFAVNTRPIITLNKQNNNTHINLLQGATFTDPGVEKVEDDRDVLKKSNITTTYEYYNGSTLSTVQSINTNNAGIYYITYSILDNDGLAGQTIRVVTVNPTATLPTISLNGQASIELTQLDTYTEAGVTVGQGVKVATIGEVKTSTPGTYVVRYIAIDENGNMNSVTRTVIVNRRTVWDFEYTGDVQTFTAPYDGSYKIELWGAQGTDTIISVSQSSYKAFGGKGAYTSGRILLDNNTPLYIYVGKEGTANSAAYNGGGQAINGARNINVGGGGATDIRYFDGNTITNSDLNCNSTIGLNSRIMVAAGGGGATNYTSSASSTTATWEQASGGSGGGLDGYQGNNSINGNRENTLSYAMGGTQVGGGSGSTSNSSDVRPGGSGLFGIGGSALNNDTSAWGGSGSGGGGYYGGGGGGLVSGILGSGAGGSSFISGYSGCNAITESSTSNNIIHTNQPNHYSGKVFSNAVMIDGKGCNWSTGSAANCGTNQPQPDGTTATGHSGNGYARITYIGNN